MFLSLVFVGISLIAKEEDSHYKMAKELVELSLDSKSIDSLVGAFAVQFQLDKKGEAFAEQFFPALVNLMREEFIQLYKKYLSEIELEEIVKFYRTKAGKKVVEIAPQVATEGVKIAMQKAQIVVAEILQGQGTAKEIFFSKSSGDVNSESKLQE